MHTIGLQRFVGVNEETGESEELLAMDVDGAREELLEKLGWTVEEDIKEELDED
jgi:hypothetical protein